MDTETLAEYFQFLDDLRDSGATNMFGARPYLQNEFGLDKAEAGDVLQKWMNTFSEESAESRAATALQ